MKIQKRQNTEFFGTKSGNTNAIAVGYATETTNYGEIATGILNKSTRGKHSNTPEGVVSDSEATLFSVGCGTSKGRKNALEVKGDGSVIISDGDANMNVADKIKEALDIEDSIKLVKSTDSDLLYTLMVNNTAKGEINIPKDLFLKNVVYDDTEKQLVFTFVTLDEDEHVERVPVGDLKDIYTAGDNITIENNKISANLSTVMTAISNEKTLRETTDNEIKSTLDGKVDLETVNQLLAGKVDFNVSDGTINIKGIQGSGFSLSDTIVFNVNKGIVDLDDYAEKTLLSTKADTSAIPTKTSQLTNDSNFITTYTETDPVWTSEKGNYYTKTEIDSNFCLRKNMPIYTVDDNGVNLTALNIPGGAGIPNSFIISSKQLRLMMSGDSTTNGWFWVYKDKYDSVPKLQLGETTISPDDLSKLTTQLDNITAATTADEVVTKFNDLLTDLKAKGFMTPDAEK